MRLFVFGTLRDPALLEVVAGALPRSEPAHLPGRLARRAAGAEHPALTEGPGAEGLLLHGLTPEQQARIDFYEALFGYVRAACRVETGAGPVDAEVYLAPEVAPSGEVWSLARWQQRCGAVVRAAAADIMAQRGHVPPAALGARYDKLLVRAASRLRAQTGAPEQVRRSARAGDVQIEGVRVAYAAFFSVEELRLRHRRFDGSMSAPLTRAAFISADAAVVLPYDPIRDRVLLVEQVRTGPLARGAENPWMLEAIAGRVDAFETPEQAARREAHEEAGLELGALIPVAQFYPTPGAKAEYLYCYVGLADLPGTGGRLGGEAGEGEDIRTHILPFARLMDLIESGEADNGALIVTALRLASLRDGLRQSALEAGPSRA